MQRGLFIPGLFVTANSKKFAAIRDSMPDVQLDIVDFSRLYQNDIMYGDFLGKLKQEMDSVKPDVVITYSYGSLLYQNLLMDRKIEEADKSVFIVPVGDYAASENGKRILKQGTNPAAIYKPINELKIAHKIKPQFFADLAADGGRTAKMAFAKNVYMISGSLDEDVDPGLFSDFKAKNTEGHIMLKDDHRMTRNMNLVCALTRSFIQCG